MKQTEGQTQVPKIYWANENNTNCSSCGEQSVPPPTTSMTNAVCCQNPDCGDVFAIAYGEDGELMLTCEQLISNIHDEKRMNEQEEIERVVETATRVSILERQEKRWKEFEETIVDQAVEDILDEN